MAVRGVVRDWYDDLGWGVVDSPETPGGCWAHFSAVEVDGHGTLHPGQHVLLEHEAVEQDGWSHRAVAVWPAEEEPSVREAESGSAAYRSSLDLTFDDRPQG